TRHHSTLGIFERDSLPEVVRAKPERIERLTRGRRVAEERLLVGGSESDGRLPARADLRVCGHRDVSLIGVRDRVVGDPVQIESVRSAMTTIEVPHGAVYVGPVPDGDTEAPGIRPIPIAVIRSVVVSRVVR